LISELSRWLDSERLGVEGLTELEAERFLATRRARGVRAFRSLAALEPLLRYLRGLGVAPVVVVRTSVTALEELIERYRRYLLLERVLTPESAKLYVRSVQTSQLTECARAAVRTKETYLAAHYAQLRGRRGEQKAIGAIRHDLLVAYFHIVRDHVPYRDLGPDWQRKRYSVEHRARRLQRQLEALGYAVTLEQTNPAEQTA